MSLPDTKRNKLPGDHKYKQLSAPKNNMESCRATGALYRDYYRLIIIFSPPKGLKAAA